MHGSSRNNRCNNPIRTAHACHTQLYACGRAGAECFFDIAPTIMYFIAPRFHCLLPLRAAVWVRRRGSSSVGLCAHVSIPHQPPRFDTRPSHISGRLSPLRRRGFASKLLSYLRGRHGHASGSSNGSPAGADSGGFADDF